MGASASQQRIVLERDAYARPMAMDVVMSPQLHARLSEKSRNGSQGYDDAAPAYDEYTEYTGRGNTTVAVDLDPGTVAFYKENVNRLIQDAYTQGLRDQAEEMGIQYEVETEERKMAHAQEKLAMRLELEKELTNSTDKLVDDLRKSFTPASAVQTDCNVPRKELMECYSEHKNDAMACSSLIDKFVECSRHAARTHGTMSGA